MLTMSKSLVLTRQALPLRQSQSQSPTSLRRHKTRIRVSNNAEEGDEGDLQTKTEEVKKGEKTWAEAFPQKRTAGNVYLGDEPPLRTDTYVSSGKPSELLKKMAGGTAPFGDAWDPVNFTDGRSDIEINKFREAELAHCRVCMLASVGIIFGENFAVLNDFVGGGITGPAIYQFQQINRPFWELIVFGIGLIETTRAQIGWMPPNEALFQLRPEYDPGNLNWDPLGLKPGDSEGLLTMRNKEINNGRLAMVGTAGMVAQELVDGQNILPLHGGMLG